MSGYKQWSYKAAVASRIAITTTCRQTDHRLPYDSSMEPPSAWRLNAFLWIYSSINRSPAGCKHPLPPSGNLIPSSGPNEQLKGAICYTAPP